MPDQNTLDIHQYTTICNRWKTPPVKSVLYWLSHFVTFLFDALKNLIHGIEKIKNVVILQTDVACLLGPKSMDSSVVLARQSHKPKLISMQPSMVSLGPHSFCLKHVVSRFDWHTCVNMQFNNYMYYNYIHKMLSNALEITTDYWRFARGSFHGQGCYCCAGRTQYLWPLRCSHSGRGHLLQRGTYTMRS